MILVFNWAGIAMVAAAFGVAYLVGQAFGNTSEAMLMLLAGPLMIAADAVYRLKRAGGHWFHPDGGGMLFFLPAWGIGIVWIVVGTYRLLADPGATVV